MKRIGIAVVAAVAFLLFLLGSASAITGCVRTWGDPNNPDDVFTCGEEVTEHCDFNGNLTCDGDGLIAKRPQTRIKGNGYRIEGNGTGTGIYSPGNNFLWIYDLEIKNFERGIWLQNTTGKKIYDYEIGTDPATPGMGCNIHQNAIGIEIDDLVTKMCIVGNCEIHSNDRGIYVHGEDGKNIKIIKNNIYDNTISGIYCEDVCAGCKIGSKNEANEVSENGEGITMNAGQWTVGYNLVTNNSGSGIYAGGSDNIFSANTIGNNKGNGIHIAGASENVTLESNTVCFNSPNDIFAVSNLSASGDNNSCENCVNYNDSSAPPGKCCVYPCVGCLGEHTGTLYRCGGAVTESCTFNGDITCPEGDGLIVGATGTAEEPIVIDGAGYSLDGVTPGASLRTGIYNPDAHDYITIKKLEVKNFHHGINIGGSPGHSGTVEYNIIDNCSVHDNGDPDGFATHGIATYHARNCSITNCTVYNNTGSGCGSCEDGGRGILLYGPGDHNTITHNRVYDNGMVGIYSKQQSKYNYVAYNDVYGNGKQLPEEGTFMPGGISLACIKTNFWTVEHNNVTDNFGSGISVGGINGIFQCNNVTNTSSATGGRGNGIYIGRCSSNHTLIANLFCKNEGEDIYVQDCCSNVTGDENTCDTADNYCDASADCPPPCVWYCSHRADFSAEPTKGAEPLVVNFTDKSTYQGNITSWFWDFGDGETSTDQNPIHTYNAICPYSYYNVSLAVEWWGGEDNDTKTETDYIVVWKTEAAPNADFSASPRKMAISPMTVEFTDQSTGDVESWFWEFGAGETSEGQNPTHEYTTGVYNVTLTVAGPGGSARDTKTDYIVVNQPDPVPAQTDAHFFASSRSGSPPLTVTFTDMSRSASDINSWKWNFGDGNTSDKQNPTHTYSTEGEGTYNVSLEVTAGGAKAKETKTGYITVAPETIFDTGVPSNPYPSIFGTHEGTIIPDQDITVNKMYTYPCEGTGGHSEYAMIWNETTRDCAEAYWDGYTGDYHNISFNRTLTLRKDVIYSYVIITGSYPQIIHAREYEAKEGGNISCTVFIDANGKKYDAWIPAIRLWKE